MPEKHLFPEWRDQQRQSKYPFADHATLTNGLDTLTKGLFLDARLFVLGGGDRQYLSSVTIEIDQAVFTIGDADSAAIAYGVLDFTSIQDTIALEDAYGRPAGVLVSSADALAAFTSWTVGEHAFTVDQAEFTATVTVPQPQPGVRGFIVEDTLFAQDVYLMGEQGVYLTQDGPYIRVDIVGDARARQRFCEQLFSFEQPWFVRTINGYGPDVYGDFKIVSGANLSTDTALRVEPQPDGLGFRLIGSVTTNAPN